MWISFVCQFDKRFVVRPFVGGVNGISGESLVGNMATMVRHLNNLGPKQDYLTLPDQPWLDGVASAPGQVKQFVSVPMTPQSKSKARQSSSDAGLDGSHYHLQDAGGKSIEFQLTGKDEVGGIQLELIPEFDTTVMSFSRVRNKIAAKVDTEDETEDESQKDLTDDLNVLESTAEQLIPKGYTIHMKNLASLQPDRRKILSDLQDESPTGEAVIHLNADYGASIDYSMEPSDLISTVARVPFDACLSISVTGHPTLRLQVCPT